jgi:glycosyltransferase involved in cell wall biosynthesis
VRIAVDAGALASSGGIARYLRQLLERALLDTPHQWDLYLRERVAGLERARQCTDGLPGHAGRIASLWTTQPLRARRERPDLFWGPAHRLPIGLPPGTARVVTIHDLCWLRAPRTMRRSTRWLDRQLMPRALRQADRIIAVSRATRDDLLQAFPDCAGRISVVHEAAAALPAPGPRTALPFTGPFVLAVGTVEPRKNHARLIEAFARLPAALREHTSLVIAGARGWGTDAPDTLAARAGVRVHWITAPNDRTLATLYRHAELLALPSLYEGFGLPVLEALAHGTPALVGDNSSLPEVAGDAGLRVDAYDTQAISQGLAALLADTALRQRLGAAGRLQAARFSWDRAARETLAVFEAALASRRASA